MQAFLCKRFFRRVNGIYLLHFNSFSSLTKSNENESPFVVNYLVNTLGFSRERALKASTQLKFKNSVNSDAVLAFFKTHNFTDDQIKRIVNNCPQILKLKPQNNLSRKIEFFQSLGASSDDIVKIVTSAGCLMLKCLDNRIVPSFDFIKNMLKSNENAVFAIKRFPRVLEDGLLKNVPPNAELLRKAGVPEVKILHLFKHYPRVLLSSHDEFKKCVERISQMRFNPLTTKFCLGICVMGTFTRLSWNYKMEVYKRWGYSEDQILLAFRRFPLCMATSEDKIDGILGHIVNKMGFEPLIFIRSPVIISASLEKTIVPRCSVHRVLTSNGLIKKNACLTGGFLMMSKESFVKKYVLRFAEEAPEVLKLYPLNLNPSQ